MIRLSQCRDRHLGIRWTDVGDQRVDKGVGVVGLKVEVIIPIVVEAPRRSSRLSAPVL